MAYKRVPFYIASELHSQLKRFAVAKGLSVSSFLRNWIKSTVPEGFGLSGMDFDADCKNGGSSFMNLCLPYSDYLQLKSVCFSIGMSVSTYIRLIIYKNIGKHLSAKVDPAVEDYQQGRYMQLVQRMQRQYDTNPDITDPVNLKPNYYQLEALFRLGYAEQLQKFFPADFSIGTQNASSSFLYIKSLLVSKDIDKAQELVKAYNNVLVSPGGLLQARLTMLSSEISYYRENVDGAIALAYKSLEMLSVRDSLDLYILGYVWLAKLYSLKGLYSESQLFLTRATMLNVHQNPYYTACILTETFLLLGLKGDFELMKRNIDKAISINNTYGFLPHLFYSFECLAKYNLVNGSDNLAVRYFEKATMIQKKFRPQVKLDYIKQYHSLTTSKYNYRKGIAQFRAQNKENLVVRKAQSLYLESATMYMYADNKPDRAEGLKRLSSLAVESGYELIKLAAKSTLVNKQLAMIR